MNLFNLQQDIPEHHLIFVIQTQSYSHLQLHNQGAVLSNTPPPPTICVCDGSLRSKIVKRRTRTWWEYLHQNDLESQVQTEIIPTKIRGVGVITSNWNAWFLLINQSSLHLCDPPPGNNKVFGIHPLGLGNSAAPPPRRAAALWWRLHTRLSSNTVAAPVTVSSSDLMSSCWFTFFFFF